MKNDSFLSTTSLNRRRFLTVAGATMAVTGAGVFSMTSARAGTGSKLHILHINDMHSRLDAISRSDGTCSANAAAEGNCFGGSARLATAIRTRRAEVEGEGTPVLALDAGDQSQGTLFYTTYSGRAEIQMMNLIGFDAMTLGNHEFNLGAESLQRMLGEANFPIVSGNTKVAGMNQLAALIKDHVIIEKGETKIGILGVTTPDTSFLSLPGDNITFEDPAEHLSAAAAALRAQGVNNIVVLSHLGFVQDQALAAAVDGISVIVGGHSHTLLSNTVEGAPAYATMVASPSGRAVPIVQSYAYSRYLGDLALEFDADGAVVSATGDSVELSMAAYEDAPDVVAAIEELRGPITTLTSTQLTTIAASIDGSRENCRARECEMGNTVADAMVSRMAAAGVTIGFANGGGLRASLEEGQITLGDVLTVLPFQNTLYTLDLPGRALQAALEHGVNGIEEGQGRFPQVSGLRFRLDPSVAPNEGRVSEVEARSADGWAPLDPDAIYTIVTNDYMAIGGDGYTMFPAEGANGYNTAIDLADALAEYLSIHEPFAPELDGRILQ